MQLRAFLVLSNSSFIINNHFYYQNRTYIQDFEGVVKVGKVAQKRWDDFIHGVISPPEHRGNVLNGPLPMGIQDIVGLFVAGVYQVKDIDAVSGTFVLSMSLRLRWRDAALADFIAKRGVKVGTDHLVTETLQAALRGNDFILPTTVFENASEVRHDGFLKLRVHDEKRKLVALYDRVTLKNDSNMFLRHFPFDLQLMKTIMRVKTMTNHGEERMLIAVIDSSMYKGWVTHNT